MLNAFLMTAGIVAAALLLGAGVLHLLPRLGAPGRKLAEACCRAPLLDVHITYFTIAPLVFGPIYTSKVGAGAWIGLPAAIVGQVVGVCIWTVLHELANRKKITGAARQNRIVHVLNRKVGRVRNHTAVWITAGAVPLFFLVRVAQYLLWPPIRVLVRFPKYEPAEWVNCSRQKFDGLVGHDLIWCLYCDWMTGIWSLGSEMLRNVESFWCPIRFDSSKKCANCSVDFPDVAEGWVPAHGNMTQVASTLEAKYPGPAGVNSWFHYPARLTINGQTAKTSEPIRDASSQKSGA